MKTKTFLPAILLSALLLQSCARYSFDAAKYFKDKEYKTDKPFKMKDGNINAPLLSKKGECNIIMNMVNGFGLQTAFAVSRNVEILAGTSVVVNSDEENQNATVPIVVTDASGTKPSYYSGVYKLKHHLSQPSFNLAIGTFETFGKSGRWEKMVGVASGSAENKYTYVVENNSSGNSNSWFSYNPDSYHFEYPYSEKRKYYQGFIQGNLGYVTQKTEGALITRLSYIHFNSQTFSESYEMKKYMMEPDNIVLEPALKFGYGGKHFRTYVQCGWNISLLQTDIQWFDTNVQAGVIFRINNN